MWDERKIEAALEELNPELREAFEARVEFLGFTYSTRQLFGHPDPTKGLALPEMPPKPPLPPRIRAEEDYYTKLAPTSYPDVFQQEVVSRFSDPRLLIEALVHETKGEGVIALPSQERLAFVGDRVIALAIASACFQQSTDKDEGGLTHAKGAINNKTVPAILSRAIQLDEVLLVGKGLRSEGITDSIRTTAMNAVTGALYLTEGPEAANAFVLDLLEKYLPQESRIDYYLELKKLVKEDEGTNLKFECIKESGPDHAKRFEVEVRWKGEAVGTAEEGSKTKAKRAAAKIAYLALKDREEFQDDNHSELSGHST